MRKIVCVFAALAVTLTTFGGVAAAENDGGSYPPKPVKIITEKPVVPSGTGFWAKAYGLCIGVPAVFTVQSITDPELVREFYGAELPAPPDGSTSWVFSPEELAGFVGPIRVGVYQASGDCKRSATTNVNIQKAQVPVKSPTVTAPASVQSGEPLTATAKNLCQGTVVFAVQSVDDWTVRWFSDPVKVNADGTASFTFPASKLPKASAYTVYAKQPECNVVATTLVKVKPQTDGGGGSNPVTPVAPETKSAAVVPTAIVPTASVTPAQVLSSGITAPTATTAGSTGTASTASAASPSTVRAASDTLPVTGSEPSRTLQIALAALVAGLGMIIVSSMRRRTANLRGR